MCRMSITYPAHNIYQKVISLVSSVTHSQFDIEELINDPMHIRNLKLASMQLFSRYKHGVTVLMCVFINSELA